MKANKKGISLIVLVITIIVIIILAAAVILTLNGNNPMNNSKLATLSQNKDSLESALSLYLSNNVTKTQGTFSTKQIVTGSVKADATSDDPGLKLGTVDMRIVAGTAGTAGEPATALVITTIDGIELFKLDSDLCKTNLEMALPSAPSSTSAWYVAPASGKVYIVFDSADDVPAYMKDGSNVHSSVSAFVLTK